MASPEPDFDLVARLDTPEHPDWTVWSDALQARGDPRGRLIALERMRAGSELSEEERALQAELEAEFDAALRACEPGGWLGVRRSSWRLGYLRELSLSYPLPFAADLRPLFACPALQGLASLELELGPEMLPGLVEALAEHPSCVRALTLFGEDFVSLGHVDPCAMLAAALPQLRRLELDAVSLASLDHPSLVELELYADATVTQLGARGGLPRLQRLGAELHGMALDRLLTGTDLPELRVLDLMNGDMRRFQSAEAIEQLLRVLCRRSLGQLDELALPHLWMVGESGLREALPELREVAKIVTTAPRRRRPSPPSPLRQQLPQLEFHEPPAAALRRLRGVLRVRGWAADDAHARRPVFVPRDQLAAHVSAVWAELEREQRALARQLLGLAQTTTLAASPLRALLGSGRLRQPALVTLRERLGAFAGERRLEQLVVELM